MGQVFSDINSLREFTIYPEGYDIPSERYACWRREFISYRPVSAASRISYLHSKYIVLQSSISPKETRKCRNKRFGSCPLN